MYIIGNWFIEPLTFKLQKIRDWLIQPILNSFFLHDEFLSSHSSLSTFRSDVHHFFPSPLHQPSCCCLRAPWSSPFSIVRVAFFATLTTPLFLGLGHFSASMLQRSPPLKLQSTPGKIIRLPFSLATSHHLPVVTNSSKFLS